MRAAQVHRVDVGFRLGPSPHEGVIARRLFPLQLIVCGTRDYFARHGVPRTISDIASHRCIAYRSPATGQVVPWRLRVGDQPLDQPVVPAIYGNDEVLELQAVLSGPQRGVCAERQGAGSGASGGAGGGESGGKAVMGGLACGAVDPPACLCGVDGRSGQGVLSR